MGREGREHRAAVCSAWGVFGRLGRDLGLSGSVEIERVGGSVGWQEDNIHRVKAKKSGISSQLFLVVGLALLRRLEDLEHP